MPAWLVGFGEVGEETAEGEEIEEEEACGEGEEAGFGGEGEATEEGGEVEEDLEGEGGEVEGVGDLGEGGGGEDEV